MAKKAKTKIKAQPKAKAKTRSTAKSARRPAAAKGLAKYEQPGAPWWKRMPLPTVK